jgi:hypothetical protein
MARWLAPERYQSYSQPNQFSDVFSFGMTCYEIIFGKVPFYEHGDHEKIKDMIMNGERPTCPIAIPIDLWSILERCWDSSVQKRPTFKMIIKELNAIYYQTSSNYFMNSSSNSTPNSPDSSSEMSLEKIYLDLGSGEKLPQGKFWKKLKTDINKPYQCPWEECGKSINFLIQHSRGQLI